MENIFYKKPELILDDSNYHLENLKLGINTLKLNHNRNKQIYLSCEKFLEIINIHQDLLNINKLHLPIKIATSVNQIFKEDKSLSIVSVQIINTKRVCNPYAGQIKIEL